MRETGTDPGPSADGNGAGRNGAAAVAAWTNLNINLSMQIGIDSFVATNADPVTGLAPTPAQRLGDLLEEIALADRAGVDVFGIGEHHRGEFLDSAPTVLLAAAAA